MTQVTHFTATHETYAVPFCNHPCWNLRPLVTKDLKLVTCRKCLASKAKQTRQAARSRVNREAK